MFYKPMNPDKTTRKNIFLINESLFFLEEVELI